MLGLPSGSVAVGFIEEVVAAVQLLAYASNHLASHRTTQPQSQAQDAHQGGAVTSARAVSTPNASISRAARLPA